jgi:hypothetical protein
MGINESWKTGIGDFDCQIDNKQPVEGDQR